MKRNITLVVENRSDINVVRIGIPHSSLAEWCACLQTLLDELVDRWTIEHQDGSRRSFVLHVGDANVSRVIGNSIDVSLDKNMLDYVRWYFFTYWRDGVASVDHVDIDDARTGGYITFAVDRSSPPISADELRKRLQ